MASETKRAGEVDALLGGETIGGDGAIGLDGDGDQVAAGRVGVADLEGGAPVDAVVPELPSVTDV